MPDLFLFIVLIYGEVMNDYMLIVRMIIYYVLGFSLGWIAAKGKYKK